MKIISISIGEETLNTIEKYCDLNSLNRSSFFVKSALKQIGEINNYVKQENQIRSGNTEQNRKPNRDRKGSGEKRKADLESIKSGNKKRHSGPGTVRAITGKPGNRKKVTRKALSGKGE